MKVVWDTKLMNTSESVNGRKLRDETGHETGPMKQGPWKRCEKGAMKQALKQDP